MLSAAVRWAAAFVFLALGATLPAHAQPASGRVEISYGPADNPAHAPIVEALKHHRVLETVQRILSPMRLPRPLMIRTTGCNGEEDAWFDGDAVTVCHEYLAYVIQVARSPRRPLAIDAHDAIVGPLLDVFLHEAGHALFDFLDIPLFGKEEDAADQFSSYAMLMLGRGAAAGLIKGVAMLYLDETGFRDFRALRHRRIRLVNPGAYADPHAVPLQRMFNVTCLAYGAAPALFGDLIEAGALPKDRAESCVEEFTQVDKAFRRLVMPHVDIEIARAVWGADALVLANIKR